MNMEGTAIKKEPKFHLSEIAKQHHREAAIRAHARLHYMVGEKNPRYGVHLSDETKAKISKATKGKHDIKGEKNPMYGKHQSQEAKAKFRSKMVGRHYHSEEHKQKLREKFTGDNNPAKRPEIREKMRKSQIGNNCLSDNPNWRGGKSFEPYCIKFNKEFKERVRAFFNYTCVECGTPQNGEKLHVHHVNFNKNSCCDQDVPRLFVALCKYCHMPTNNKREYWEKRYTDIINTHYQGKCYFTKEEYSAFILSKEG